jgi:hypothetical protein
MLRQLGSIIALKPAARFETPTHLLRTTTARMQQRQGPPGLQRSRYVLRQSSETPRATVAPQSISKSELLPAPNSGPKPQNHPLCRETPIG